MLHINADQGEGGGQVLRTALALSAVRGIPLHLRGIRARRKTPGLQAQHVTAVAALARICGAAVDGLALGSQELTFVPGAVRPGQYHFDVGTAGAVTLVLQGILLPLSLADGPSRVTLSGGTHVPWSPTTDYVQTILLPRLAEMGIRARLDVHRWGLYPKGGGRISVEVAGRSELLAVTWACRTGGLRVRGVCAAVGLPCDVAERQRSHAMDRLRAAGHDAAIAVQTVGAADRGAMLFLAAQGDGASGGFSSLGTGNDPPGRVVDEAVGALLDFARTEAACDPFLADQVVAALALANGTSRFTTSRVTPHLLTAVSLVQQILGCPAQVRGELGAAGSVTVEGVGVDGSPRERQDSRPCERGSARRDGGSLPAGTVVRKARAADGPAIQRLLAQFAARGELLHRTLTEVYQHLRDFAVCEVDGQIVGVCALWLYWEDLAEVRSLAVDERWGGRGLGKALVGACLDEARGLGIRRVFALTYRPGFFERLGFCALDKRELPQKIWKDCIRCAKFTCCDEIALIRDTAPARDGR